MPATERDKEWVGFADRLQEESDLRRDQTGVADAELNLKFARGQQGAQEGIPGLSGRDTLQYKFVMNLVGGLVKRKVALITDTRPQIHVEPREGAKRRGTADTFKRRIEALWEEQQLEQDFAYELFRAGTIGSTLCVPVWDPTADFGRGDHRLRFYDPRWFAFDPSVTRARKLQEGEYLQVREVVSLPWVKERYPSRAADVEPNRRWSQYQKPEPSGFWRGVVSAVSQSTPWSLGPPSEESAIPRSEMRHTWFKDFPRDRTGKPMFGQPRIVRHVVDDGRVVLADNPLSYWHGQMPGHLFDWGLELEHAYGESEVAGLRRIQYTLNRIIGQIVENVLLTNRVKVIADNDAVDKPTWDAISKNGNGLFIRKKLGRTFHVDLPVQFPAHVLALVQFLIAGIDMVSGMSEAARGMRPAGVISGAAISELSQQAQTIIRMEARSFESWLSRIFQQVVANIWQFDTSDRLLTLVGANQQLMQFEFDRAKFRRTDDGTDLPQDAWQDFQFRVMPGSSLASTRIQRGVIAMNLYQAGLIPGAYVLRAAEWEDPEETVARAQEERAKNPPPVSGNGRPPKMIRIPGSRAGGM